MISTHDPMEHLALYSPLGLEEFCHRLQMALDFPVFTFDVENENQWGEAEKEGLRINVSRPFEPGTLQSWDESVADGCNFGIILIKTGLEAKEIEAIGTLLAQEFHTSVFYHRSYIAPGKNIVRNKEFRG
ncbi:MAG: hypothetical protein AAF696_00310 [Bacteroidota bacterium]